MSTSINLPINKIMEFMDNIQFIIIYNITYYIINMLVYLLATFAYKYFLEHEY